MDPQELLRQILEETDPDQRAQKMMELGGWLEGGGQAPEMRSTPANNFLVELIGGRFQLLNLHPDHRDGYVLRCWATDVNENPNRIIREWKLA